jgi:dihydroorotate dehydrogenase
MAASSAVLAWRSAGLGSRAFATPRWTQRPAVLPKRTALQPRVTSRYASDAPPAAETVKETAKEAPKKGGRGARRTFLGASLALTLVVGYIYGTDTRASAHRYVVVPLIRWLYPDAEDAHHLGVDTLKTLYKYGLHPRERGNPDGDGALATEVIIISLGSVHLRQCLRVSLR